MKIITPILIKISLVIHAQAIEHELTALRQAEIDTLLTEMAQDKDYQSEVLKMEAEFSPASWEALQLEEQS